VLNDQSGLYRDFGGPTSVLAARMAVEDFGVNVFGRPIEVIDAEHQNKADLKYFCIILSGQWIGGLFFPETLLVRADEVIEWSGVLPTLLSRALPVPRWQAAFSSA
jgi:hypothetical protein